MILRCFKTLLFLLVGLISIIVLEGPARGQGIPPFSTVEEHTFDNINLQNRSVMVAIPVRTKVGPLPFSFQLTLNSYVTLKSGPGHNYTIVIPLPFVGSTSPMALPASTSILPTFVNPNDLCPDHVTQTTSYNDWAYIDPTGAQHKFAINNLIDSKGCLATGFTTSVDGYTLNVSNSPAPWQASMTDPSGNVISTNGGNPNGNTFIDPNGNTISILSSGNVNTYTDSMGQTVLTSTIPTGGTGPDVYSWTDASANTRSVTVNYTQLTQHTNFAAATCPFVDIAPIARYFPTSVSLPDGTSYGITYEPTPGYPTDVTGRIASLSLPTGGTITYTYSGGSNGVNCLGGISAFSTNTIARGTSDGTTTYSGSDGNSTTVTDAAGNQTVYTFSSGFETVRNAYQGSATTGTLLLKELTCYNNDQTCSQSPVYPFSQVDKYTTLGTMSSSSRTTTFYDGNNLPIETKAYDFGGATPLVDTTTVYGSWNGSACVAIGNGIVGKPCSITVTPSGTGTPKAQTLLTYDSRGNATQTKRLVSGTGTFLTSHATYFANGTLQTKTDPQGTITTYTQGACNGSLPTQISAGGLTTKMTWDCNGGAMTSVTDANNQLTSFAHNDPFWRTTAVTDPLLNVTNLTLSPTRTERSLSFGSSISDSALTVDTYGRPMSIQTKRAPTGNYDTVSRFYDVRGLLATVTTACATSLGSNCAVSPATIFTYDALGRPLVTTTPLNGTVSNTYTNQDVLQVIGPAPSGENTKRKQFEYDGLGRLSSVCELSTLAGSGPCGQAVSQIGFLTAYTYDTLGRVTDVVQNGQTRHFVYDDLGRLTSERNPENGTISYLYDSAAGCTGSSKGDLIKKTDAVGNVSCYQYDTLHRVTGITYTGPYSANTPAKTFVYDAATINGTGMTNVAGRLAEAYTGTHTYDLGLSYSARGELTDVYENTPHSSGWYHTTASYFANGALNVLGGVPGKNAWTFGVDAKGRHKSVVYGASTNLVTNAAYNSLDEPTSVTLGSGDSDSFSYGTSGLINKYQATIGTTPQIVSGTLTRNANGSVRKLVIADPINTANVQTCNYVYDDLRRASSVNCGTPWTQTFGYDAFGNITQSGSLSFQPTYSNNRISSLPGCGTLSYDANGNLLNDCTHSYTWDSENRMLSIDSTTNGYDALGRLAETNIGGTIKEILYSPIGKLGNMSGQSSNRLFVPLIGGTKALYISGNQYYTHPDWLGSARLISTNSSTAYDDVAFSPFGKDYANLGSKTLDFTGQQEESFSLSSGDTFDFTFRKFSQAQGRWISPDPARPFSFSDPQSFNLYAYVENTPLASIDPEGLGGPCHQDDDCPTPPPPPSDDRRPPSPTPWSLIDIGPWHATRHSGAKPEPTEPTPPTPKPPPCGKGFSTGYSVGGAFEAGNGQEGNGGVTAIVNGSGGGWLLLGFQ